MLVAETGVVLAACNLTFGAATFTLTLFPDKPCDEIISLFQDSARRIDQSRNDIREYSLYLKDDEVHLFNGRVIAVDKTLTNLKSEYYALTRVGKLVLQSGYVNRARSVEAQCELTYKLIFEASTVAKMKYEKEHGLNLVIQSEPSVLEQDQLESLQEALTDLSFIQQPQQPAIPDEPRPPINGRNVGSIASMLGTPHFSQVLATPSVIPFLLSRVAQHRGSVALPSITLDPPNLTRPIEMSDMNPLRVEGSEAQSSEDEIVAGNVD